MKFENSELFESIMSCFKKVLKKLMICRFNKFKWFEYLILKMSSNTHKDINCVIEKEYKLTLKNMKNKIHKQIQKKFNAQTKKWVEKNKHEKFSQFNINFYFKIAWKFKLVSCFLILKEIVKKYNLQFTENKLH